MEFLSVEIQDKLRKEGIKAEKIGNLTDFQLDIIYSKKLFNLFVPKSLGGLEFDLLEGLKLLEKIAKIDASLGWTVTLCSGANTFAGYLSKDIAEDIFKDTKVCFGGSGKIGGIAEENEGGYIINGKWNYVTGTPHLTIFTANCQIKKNGKLLIHDDGTPLYKSFFFLPNEVHIIEDWNTMGLIATASHSYEAKNLYVNKNRSFSINTKNNSINYLLYQYPFLPFAELTLAVNHLGIQEHFLEIVEVIFNSIQNPIYKESGIKLLENATQDISDRRKIFFKYAEESWEELKNKGEISEQLIGKISALSRDIVKKGREKALQVYPYLGISASNPETEINRVLRDILTASQHSLLL